MGSGVKPKGRGRAPCSFMLDFSNSMCTCTAVAQLLDTISGTVLQSGDPEIGKHSRERV